MALELENNLVKINRLLQEDSTQNIIESDIIVPDIKPDVISILHVDGEVKVNSKEIYKDAVVLRGTVCFKTLYMSDDPSRLVCSTEHTVNFDQTVDIFGIESNMSCYLTCRPEHIDCSIINGRKLNVKAVLKVDSKVIEPTEVGVVSDITGLDNVQIMTQSFETYNEVEYDSVETGVICEADIPIGKPAIKDVLRTDASIKESDIKLAGGKAVVKGTLEVSTLYVPDMDEAPVDCIVSEVPFSEVLDMQGINEDADVSFTTEVTNVSAVVKEDDDGDSRVVEYSVGLGFKPSAVEKQICEVVSDAYALASKLEIERNPVKVTTVAGEAKTQSSLKDGVELPAEMPPVRQMYNLSCKAVVTDVDVDDGKVNVEGVIETTVIYLSDEGRPVGSHRHHTPFRHALEVRCVPHCAHPKAVVHIDSCTYDLVDDRHIELKFTMTVAVRVFNHDFVDVVTRVDELPLDERRMAAQPSMIVYYIQNGDTLWGIAKRYFTTVNDLMKVNSIGEQDTLTIGQQLLIPKAS